MASRKKINGKVRPLNGATLTKAKKAGFNGTPPKKPAVKDQTEAKLKSYFKSVTAYNKKVNEYARKYERLQKLKKKL